LFRLILSAAVASALAWLPVSASADDRTAPPQLAQAQPAVVPSKIAVLDLTRVLREAVSVKAVNKQMAGYREGFQKAVQTERGALKTADQELGRQRQILSPEAFADERRKFEQKVREAQLRADQRIRELERVRNGAMLKIQRALNKVVADLARERGYALVIRSTQTVVVDSTLDLTVEVLKRIDKALPSVGVDKPKLAGAQ